MVRTSEKAIGLNDTFSMKPKGAQKPLTQSSEDSLLSGLQLLCNKSPQSGHHLVNYLRAEIFQQHLNRNWLDQETVGMSPMVACPMFAHLKKAFSCESMESVACRYLRLLTIGMLLYYSFDKLEQCFSNSSMQTQGGILFKCGFRVNGSRIASDSLFLTNHQVTQVLRAHGLYFV